ncbi:2-oxoglutarate dehydrogenase complex dihydrolipoyllysine-residue succinyltransferase [Polynucleobacter necessarius]|uniref:2-oxoglutarate dehydrogenase complex dihydrolipoyllysine-residue succinyltransferase n=1 Tax=Polynucleobacter necessarius TaxID=576610 RepID=UPI000FE1B671|nr:2-oxoglutarate dehydrogenase complex dihydrolipoyllysine-residue succinyltransferase [Polynucleobacter necessarius]
MAIFEVKVPQLSESVAEATLLQWKKKVGDAVGQDEILIEIETDKVVLEVPAPSAGVLTEIVVADGGTVIAEQLIAKIDSTAVAAAAPAKAAAPSAAKILAEKGVDAGQVAGSGRDGRITKGDALNASAGGAKSAALPSAPIPMGDRPEERVPMSRLRARIAERLLESQANNAILTTFNEVKMGPVIALRNKYKDQFEKTHGVKLGFMSFFVKAATHALKKFPLLNASVDGNDIVYHGYFDIGIAVSSPRGLVVPILRDVDQMNLADIEKKIAEFGTKAREGKLSIEELTGGTFSISNGGVFGSMLSTPIINPPQSAILGIHATKDRAVVENGQVVVRPINYLALSYDHRIIDGREAVLGLVAMKDALEDPSRLLLDL